MARPKDWDVEQAIEIFCQALIDGHRQRDAYRIAHPNNKSTNKRALDVKACEFAHRPDVQERLRELRQELHERHQAFTDSLVEMLQEEITTCYRDNKTLSPVMKQVELAARVLGMEKQTVDINAKVGAFDDSSAADKVNFLIGQAKKGSKK